MTMLEFFGFWSVTGIMGLGVRNMIVRGSVFPSSDRLRARLQRATIIPVEPGSDEEGALAEKAFDVDNIHAIARADCLTSRAAHKAAERAVSHLSTTQVKKLSSRLQDARNSQGFGKILSDLDRLYGIVKEEKNRRTKAAGSQMAADMLREALQASIDERAHHGADGGRDSVRVTNEVR